MTEFEKFFEKMLTKREGAFLTIAVDVDGTLTKSTCWTENDCLNAIPNWPVVDLVKRLYGEHYVIIWTARARKLREATEKWLHLHDIPYHLYDDKKNPYSMYIDDRSFNPCVDEEPEFSTGYSDFRSPIV